MAFGFMFFRSESMEKVGDMIHAIIFDFHPEVWPQILDGYFLIIVTIVIGFLLHFSPKSWSEGLKSRFTAQSLVVQAIILALVIFVIIQVRSSDLVPFIYLQY